MKIPLDFNFSFVLVFSVFLLISVLDLDLAKSATKQRKRHRPLPKFKSKLRKEDWVTKKLHEYEKRRKTLEDTCNKYPSLQNRPIYAPTFSRSNKTKVIGCTINKSASTTLNEMLLNIEGYDVHKKKIWGYVNRVLITQTEAEFRYNLENFTTFIFVREPMERLASSYYGKMIVNPAKTLKQYRINVKKKAATIMSKPYNVNETVTFEEFLKVLFLRKNPDVKAFSRHWAPYYKTCSPCSLTFDIIGKINVGRPGMDDLSYIWKKTHTNMKQKMPWSNSNLSSLPQRKQKLSELYRSVPRETLISVFLKLKVDYELFGYDFNQVLKMAGYPILTEEENKMEPYIY